VTDKTALRSTLAAARKARTQEQRELARAAIRQHVMAECRSRRLPAGSVIAAYEPLPTEPGSIELLAELAEAGYRVIVPLTLADRDLDWVAWNPGIPPGRPLGLTSIAAAGLLLVPAFAVDLTGNRLGRGGGSYDRALARVNAGTPVAALLYSEEVLAEVPVDAWDLPVTSVVTPDGWRELCHGRGRDAVDAVPE
jgi:5-formyltetrahydrofolate cyclo-ligase